MSLFLKDKFRDSGMSVKVAYIVGMMRLESAAWLVGCVDDPDDEGAWYTLPAELFTRAERDMYVPIVPVFERGALVDWSRS